MIDALPAIIRRIDGVTVRLSYQDPDSREIDGPYWARKHAIHCLLCGLSWKAGLVGYDSHGHEVTAICLDCGEALHGLLKAALRANRDSAQEGGDEVPF